MKHLIFTSLLLSSILGFSQSPGGVSSDLELWYKADAGVTTGVDGISSWSDNSGNGINGSASGSSSPQLISSELNANPIVRFDGNDRISTTLDINSGTFPNLDVITIYNPTSNNSGAVFGEDNYGWDRFLMDDAASSSNLEHVISAGSIGANVSDAVLFQLNTPIITAISWQEDVSNGSKYYVNGVEEGSFSANNGPQTSNTMQVGDIGNSIFPFNGDIAEIIVYGNTKTSNERQRIESYLSIKYGISLSQSSGNYDYLSSNGSVIWNATTNSSYSNSITGIGRDDNSGLNQLSSTNQVVSDIIEVTSSSFSTNNSYLIWGHNGGSTLYTSSQVPSVGMTRLNRIWKAASFGSPGNVTVSFDISNSGVPGDYALLIDTDSDFSSVATIQTSGITISGNTISFSGVSLSNNSFFTLAYTPSSEAPGGVSSDLALWYKANDGVSASGGTVSAWNDRSGNSVNGTLNGSGLELVSGGLNNNEVVRFAGSGRINTALNINSGTYPNVDVITIYKPTSTSPGGVVGEDDGNWDRFFLNNTSFSQLNNAISYGSWTVSDAAIFPLNQPVITTISWREDVSNGSKCYIRGNEILSFTSNHGPETSNPVQIGDIGTSLYPFTGDIAEVIIFNSTQGTTERQRIESYLAIKYGVSLDQSSGAYDYLSSSGAVIWNGTTNSSFSTAIAGIGRDDNSALNQLSSSNQNESGIIEVTASSFSTDNAFLIWGHNGESVGTTTTGVHPFYTNRLERIWRAEVNGTTGSVSVSFDLSSGITNSGNASDYALITDNSDTDFSSGATAFTTASISGNIITFTGVTINDGDYFTLAYGESIVWDGSTWENGSGVGESPNTSDGTRKMLVTGTGGTLSTNATVEVVNVTASGEITIASGVTLEVNGDITNDGTIIVESGGSLVQNTVSDGNSGSGEYQVQRNSGTLVDDTRYQYWSSSVSNTSMGAAFPGSNTTDFYYFDEGATNNWASQPSGSTMTPGRGYITTGTIGLSSTSDDRSFDGNVNNGTIELTTSSVSSGESILAGNPYPSAISSSDFVTTNTGISGTLWFWNHTTYQVGGGSSGINTAADYATWTSTGATTGNGSTLPNDYIQSAQGFFVESTSANPTITFNNDMRVSGNNTQFFKQEATSTKNRVWLALSNDSNDYNQLLVGFLPEATDGVDRLYDGKKYKAHPRLSFYSVLDSTDYSIQGLKTLNDEQTKVIPLGVDAWITGNHTIFVDSLDNWPSDYTLQLVDSLEGIEQNLLDQPVYSFYVDSVTSIRNRFYLAVYNEKDTVATSTGVVDYESFVKIYSSQQEIIVESKDVEIQSIRIYNVNGQLIHASTPQTSVERILSKDWLTGVYIVQCKLNDGTIKRKKIVR
jgi:hypothetical protein